MTTTGNSTTWIRLGACALSVLSATVGVGAAAQTGGDNPGRQSNGVAASTGAQVYGEICKACHMANAQGGTGAGAIPALAHNPHLADADYVTHILLKGRGGMPAFKGMLTPAQIAGVATYVRTHFNNNYPKPVTVADVARVQSGGGAR